MQFSKQVLIDKAKAAIKADRKKFDDSLAAYDKSRAAEEKKWLKEQGPKWDKYIATLTAVRKAGGIITYETEDSVSCEYLYPRYSRPNPDNYQPPQHLLSTIELLEAVIGDTVGSSVLSLSDIKRIMGG